MGGGAFHVGSDTTGDVCGLFFANVFDTLRRDTDYEAAGRVLLSLWDEGAGGHYGAIPYLRPVQDGGAHAYEAALPYLAAVHDRVVAHDALVADDGRVARVGVQDAAVQDVGAGLVSAANGQVLSLLTPQEDTKSERRKRLSTLGR